MGHQWLTMVQTNVNSIDEEVAYWTQGGIVTYIVQWQNYKISGLINTYMIESAFGVQYPMTLMHTNGSYNVASQTSFKMYWGLASDLWAVANNSTLLGGKSLIQNSSYFGFMNQSMLVLLTQNKTLMSPLSAGFMLVQNRIGPFGSIDMVYVPPPASANNLMATSLDLIRATIFESASAASTFAAISTDQTASVAIIPQLFLNISSWMALGGSLLCGDYAGGPVGMGLTEFTSRTTPCNLALLAEFVPTRDNYVMSALSLQLKTSDIVPTCSHHQSPDVCASNILSPAVAFSTNFTGKDARLMAIQTLATEALTQIWAAQVSLMQFVQENTTQPLEMICSDPSG
ncbi:Aste57867_7043 [Aphanomyces stellatus]|uniref:Aste57867_7043 protein n=1 Tax=Aphanomyces stellatus TaxID=120398 RepID=A0A485KFF1_9STRA|nr:hypothetical protein As57867_007020 [Aphanomyces stellatus]VFT83991.1 Aste57867_7043 [Aphanomyces stellatus]